MDAIENRTRVDGVIIGLVTAIGTDGAPLVAYSGNRSELPVAAKTTVMLDTETVGREVALLFEGGDLTKPIVMGLIQKMASKEEPLADSNHQSSVILDPQQQLFGDGTTDLRIDGERVELTAKQEIVLKCGKSSITMTRAGKVIIRGAYISTKSSGANRIKGGSVQIN